VGEAMVVHRVRCISIWFPADDARFSGVALEGQGALIGSEGLVVVRRRTLYVWRPVAETAHAGGRDLAGTGAMHSGVDANGLESGVLYM